MAITATRLQVVLCLGIGLTLTCCGGRQPGLRDQYAQFNLESYCRNDSAAASFPAITLPCLDGPYQHQAGTIRLRYYPAVSCNATIAIDTSPCAARFSIYLNVRQANLNSQDSVRIYESGVLVKLLHGHQYKPSYKIDTVSVAQVRSAFSRYPVLKLVFDKDLNSTNDAAGGFLILDYTVVRGLASRPNETLCTALGGYVPNKYVCDREGRMYCPSTYTASVALNPATETQAQSEEYAGVCGKFVTTPPPDHHQSEDCFAYPKLELALPWYYIVGIILVLAFLLLVMIGEIALWHRRMNRMRVASRGVGVIGGAEFRPTDYSQFDLSAVESAYHSDLPPPLDYLESYKTEEDPPPDYALIFPTEQSPPSRSLEAHELLPLFHHGQRVLNP